MLDSHQGPSSNEMSAPKEDVWLTPGAEQTTTYAHAWDDLISLRNRLAYINWLYGYRGNPNGSAPDQAIDPWDNPPQESDQPPTE